MIKQISIILICFICLGCSRGRSLRPRNIQRPQIPKECSRIWNGVCIPKRPRKPKSERSERMTITAEEAREIATANRQTLDIDKFVDTINQRIRVVAESGARSFDPWVYFTTVRMPMPSCGERNAIRLHFMSQGFAWVETASYLTSAITITLSW